MTKEELLKTAKPILFNTEMVQAILNGLKTTTRKLIVNGRVKSWCDYDSYKLRFCPECGRKIEQEGQCE